MKPAIDHGNNIVRLGSGVRITEPDASRALERAWLRRRQELAGWQPSGGWLMDQKAQAVRTAPGRAR